MIATRAPYGHQTITTPNRLASEARCLNDRARASADGAGRRASTRRAGRIDFAKPHAPLLLIAGTRDHIVPARLNRSNYRRYRASPSPTQFKEFAGRDHFIIGEPGWEEVASYALDWLAQN